MADRIGSASGKSYRRVGEGRRGSLPPSCKCSCCYTKKSGLADLSASLVVYFFAPSTEAFNVPRLECRHLGSLDLQLSASSLGCDQHELHAYEARPIVLINVINFNDMTQTSSIQSAYENQ